MRRIDTAGDVKDIADAILFFTIVLFLACVGVGGLGLSRTADFPGPQHAADNGLDTGYAQSRKTGEENKTGYQEQQE